MSEASFSENGEHTFFVVFTFLHHIMVPRWSPFGHLGRSCDPRAFLRAQVLFTTWPLGATQGSAWGAFRASKPTKRSQVECKVV